MVWKPFSMGFYLPFLGDDVWPKVELFEGRLDVRILTCSRILEVNQ